MCSIYKNGSSPGKLLITRFPLEAGWGGEEEVHLLLAQVLRENGMDVEILTSQRELRETFIQEGFSAFPEFEKDLTSRMRLFWSALLAPFFFLRGLFWLPYFRWRGVRSVLFLTFVEKVFWTPLARLCGLRVIWGHHAPLGDWFFRNPFLFFWKLWAKKTIRIVVPSEAQRQELFPLGALAEKIIVLPNVPTSNKICAHDYDEAGARKKLKNLVQEKLGKTWEQEDAFLTGTANRLSPEKGMGDALEAMKMLHSGEESYILLCAGSGPEQAALEEKSRTENLTESIFFLGFLSPEELRIFYQGIDLFLLASHREPFGIALLEAMAAQKAIIASSVGGIPEVLGEDNPGLFPPHDPAQIAARIHFFRTEDEKRHELGTANFKRFRQHFSSNEFSTKALSIFFTRN